MATFITVYHSGLIITNEIGSYEFVGMKSRHFYLMNFQPLKIWLVWCASGCVGWTRIVKYILYVELI
jgi:hypothetical protein